MDEVVLGACRGKWRLGGRIVAAQPANTGGRMEGAGHNVRRNQSNRSGEVLADFVRLL